MNEWTLTDLYLAWRHAKSAHFHERPGLGLLAFARYESSLPTRLRSLQEKLRDSCWFDRIPVGQIWVTPKRLQSPGQTPNEITRIGSGLAGNKPVLDVQLRLTPSPEYAIVEMLFLMKYGPALDSILSANCVGYRLETRKGRIDPTGPRSFEFWPDRYQEFRSVPLRIANEALSTSDASVVMISADLKSFYDNIDPQFLTSDAFCQQLHANGLLDTSKFKIAAGSLLGSFERYRERAKSVVGFSLNTGIPIGALTSRVVANLALDSLDRHIESCPDLLCYRRYVDDIVVVAKAPEKVGKTDILQRFLPLADVDESKDVHVLDVTRLGRQGSNFTLQAAKTRLHHLTGRPGSEFVRAIQMDFDRMVSRAEAFVDTRTLLSPDGAHLVRATNNEGSPLRVLRDADRVHLERFALSTSLRTLEKAAVLLSEPAASRLISSTMRSIARVSTEELDWVETFETRLRLLRLALATRDWPSAKELSDGFDDRFGDSQRLHGGISELRYRSRSISDHEPAWHSLRDFLHQRRLESVAASIPSGMSPTNLKNWTTKHILVGLEAFGAGALRRRALDLARADLRAFDREDDLQFHSRLTRVPATADSELVWFEDELPDLHDRFETIRTFLNACRELGDTPWLVAPSRLFLASRPPSYFDISRRLLYGIDWDRHVSADVFKGVVDVVNAVRGTHYRDPVASWADVNTISVKWPNAAPSRVAQLAGVDPLLMLGNLIVKEDWLNAVVGGNGTRPTIPSDEETARLAHLNDMLNEATRLSSNPVKRPDGRFTRRPALLVLPELAVPRAYYRDVAQHVAQHGAFGLVMGLEYHRDPRHPFVYNQVVAILPTGFNAVATWPWTKRYPAVKEGTDLLALAPPLRFKPAKLPERRLVVQTTWGNFSVLICSELIEAERTFDLFRRCNLVLCPAWNPDTSSYDHLIQSVGLQLHAIVAVANNGMYSDCRAWAPFAARWQRDLCRLIDREGNRILSVVLPMKSLTDFHEGVPAPPKDSVWKPLPPGWK